VPTDEFYRKTKSVKKAKEPKTPKVDTKEVTLILLREGKTPMEIAIERKMTQSTIEGHLAYFIAKQEINANQIISTKKLAEIVATIVKLKTIKMNEIREHLGRAYSFGEIKIAIAAYLAEGN
jgi:uncharacterized protein YpbB